MLLEFVGQLLSAKDGSFTSQEGGNKGQTYNWTELEFNSQETGTFILRTVAPVVIPADKLGVHLKWTLGVIPKQDGRKSVKFKVVHVDGSKLKG